MLRMLDALDNLATLTTSPRRLRAIQEQMQLIAEVAGRTMESKHYRDRLARRPTEVRESLKVEPAFRILEERE